MQQSVLLAAPKEVDIGVIEQELVQLWKTAGEGTSTTDAPVIRACSLNLVLFTEGTERASGLEDIVSQITIDHPSRIFLVSADRRAAQSGIRVWVSARCSLPAPGEQQVCCEEINVTATGKEVNKVPSIITSLLVPDIPMVLLWRARADVRDMVLMQLAQVAERVLIDSSEDLDPREPLLAWSRFIDEGGERMEYGDLAWTHLMPWRSVLAQAFQQAPLRACLQTLDRVTAEYSSSPKPVHSGLSQALLVAGWLSHVLGWVLIHSFREEADRLIVARVRQGEQAISIILREVPVRGSNPGGVESITLHSSDGTEVVVKPVAEREDCILLRSSLPGSPPVENVVMIPHHTEAELISGELDVLYNDPMFESSMFVIARMLGAAVP